MASSQGRYSLRSKGKASAPATDEKATAPLVSNDAAPKSMPSKKRNIKASSVTQQTPAASSKAIGKRKRADTQDALEQPSPPEPSKEEQQLERELNLIKPLGNKISEAKCQQCQHPLFPGVNLQQHLEAWTSRSSDCSPISVIHCPRADCYALTCIGCGLQPRHSGCHSHVEKRTLKPFGIKNERANNLVRKETCCTFGGLASVWILLSYFDDRFAPDAVGKPAATSRPRPAKAKKSSKKKSHAERWPKGVGYASGYDDFDDYMPPPFAPTSGKDPNLQEPNKASKTLNDSDHLIKSLLELLTDAIQDLLGSLAHVPDDTVKDVAPKKAKVKSKQEVSLKPGEGSSAKCIESEKGSLIDMLSVLFSLSWFPAMLAELLRNDSVEAATDRADLYMASLKFIDSMLDSKASSKLVAEGYRVKAPSRSLANMLEEGELFFRTEGLKPEKATTLLESIGNLLKAARSLLASAKQAPPSVYSDDSGRQQLNLCKRIELTGGRVESYLSGGTVMPSKQSTLASNIDRLELLEEKIITSRYTYSTDSTFSKPTQPKRMRVLFQEISVLTTSLPEGVFLKVAMNRPDMMKALIVGPESTPYEGGLFEFDILCPEHYPNQPPKVSCATASFNGLRLNPNLYENGYVCLSLINTWSGTPSEQWQPGISTLLQVLVSIQSMIFVRDPGENEPGGSGSNTAYNRKIETFTVISIISWIKHSTLRDSIWRDPVVDHFKRNAENILATVRGWSKQNPQIKKFQKNFYSPSAFAPPPTSSTGQSGAPPPKPQERDLLKELEEALTEFL